MSQLTFYKNSYFHLAHCVDFKKLPKLTVLAGVNSLLDQSGQRRTIISCKSHPKFEMFESGDIAVCKVFPPFNFNEKVNKVELHTAKIEDGTNCTLTGWGSVMKIPNMDIPYYDLISYPMHLQEITLKTISNKECNLSYDSLNETEIVNEEMCTLTTKDKGNCSG